MNDAEPTPETAQAGDIVVIAAHHVGEPERLGEILETLGTAGHVHYRVRWDDGTETLFYPGGDATTRPSRHHRP